jgi:hypothetical protein
MTPPLKSIASASVVFPELEFPSRAMFLRWSVEYVFMFRLDYII